VETSAALDRRSGEDAVRSDVAENEIIPAGGELDVGIRHEEDRGGRDLGTAIAGVIVAGVMVEGLDADVDLGFIEKPRECRDEVRNSAVSGGVVYDDELDARAAGARARDAVDGRRDAGAFVVRRDDYADVRLHGV